MTRDSLTLADQKIGDMDYYAGSGLWRRAATTPTAVTFAAGNFTADSGNWTLASGDQINFQYSLLGKLMYVTWALQTTTVSATPVYLKIALPAGKTLAARSDGTHAFLDNGTQGIGYVLANSGETFIRLYTGVALNTWATATDTTASGGNIWVWVV